MLLCIANTSKHADTKLRKGAAGLDMSLLCRMWGGRSGGTSFTGCVTRTPPTLSCKTFCPHTFPRTIKLLTRFGTTSNLTTRTMQGAKHPKTLNPRDWMHLKAGALLSCTATLAHWQSYMHMYCGMYICMCTHMVIARWHSSTLYIQHGINTGPNTCPCMRMHSVSMLSMYTCVFSAASRALSQGVGRTSLTAVESKLHCADCHVCLVRQHHHCCNVGIQKQ